MNTYQHLWVRLSYKGCKEDKNKNKNWAEWSCPSCLLAELSVIPRSLVLPNILALGFTSNRETVNLTAGAKYARANHASIMCRRKSGKSSICQPDSGEATITVFFTMASENSQEHFWGKAIFQF